MKFFRNWLWIKVTLFFFTTMLFYQPAFATKLLASSPAPTNDYTIRTFPIHYVTQDQLLKIFQKSERLGYQVKQGSLKQLQQLLLAQDNTIDEPSKNGIPDKNLVKKPTNANKQTECKSVITSTSDQTNSNNNQKTKTQQTDCNSHIQNKKDQQPGHGPTSTTDKNVKPMSVTMPKPTPPTEPSLPNKSSTNSPGTPQTVTPQANVNLDLDIFHGGGGNGGDSAKVFFIITGIFVVAAFVVYAGKYVVDIAQGKNHDLWWELTLNNTYLDTKFGQNGHFRGIKIATGLISSALFQVALVGELGTTDLKLTLNEDSTPIYLDFSANYWMLGATTRLHLTDTLVNASYLYLEFMGGKTDRSEADTIGAARAGASFGINNYLRLGASIGAQYIGLNNDQGFINNNDKYWYTYGFEIGVRF